MAKPRNSVSSQSHCLHFLFSLLLLHFCSEFADSHNIIKYLPGFDGSLPFQLETGYVGDAEEIQLFYYFVETETNPAEDPLLLWLSGGPACSSLFDLLYQIGPLNFQVTKYNGSLPGLALTPYSWTKVSSIIFLDLPIGAGFSYSRSQNISGQAGSLVSYYQAQQFLRKWLMDRPEFQSNAMYVGGVSHSGYTVPVLSQDISDGNEKGSEPFINLKGYILGIPGRHLKSEGNSRIPFSHGMGLISDELYESLKRNCKGEYLMVEPSNLACLNAVKAYEQHNSDYSGWSNSRRLSSDDEILLLHPNPDIPIGCRTYGYLLSSYWANNEEVQKTLQIRKGTIKGKWKRCNDRVPYEDDVSDSFPYHVNLSSKGYRSLIYSGDHDMVVPFQASQAWIRDLNYTITDDWRPGQSKAKLQGSYARTYSNGMTFTTVKVSDLCSFFSIKIHQKGGFQNNLYRISKDTSGHHGCDVNLQLKEVFGLLRITNTGRSENP